MAHPVVIELLPCINLIIAGHKAHFGRCDIGEIRNGLRAKANQIQVFIDHNTAVNTGKAGNDVGINRDILFLRRFYAQIIALMMRPNQ